MLYLLAQLLLQEKPLTKELNNDFRHLIQKMQEFRDHWETNVKEILNFLDYRLEFLYFIARDPASLACAKLSALRVKTYHGQLAEGISLGLFFHGAFQIFERSQSEKQGAIILLGNKEITEKGDKEMVIRLLKLIRERAGRIVILSNNAALKTWIAKDPEILVVDFDSKVEELAPVFENFILSLAFLKIAKEEGLVK